MSIKAFRDWKFEEVELTFGIERVFDEHPLLSDWLAAIHQPSEDDGRVLFISFVFFDTLRAAKS